MEICSVLISINQSIQYPSIKIYSDASLGKLIE